ncbi:MAG: MtrB/PioB family outer membrane beta-barrel protein, partial [Acidobacteria bacterium]|nr:MtrB/PioB family outer membrane beta-barrel protein [Acidobacteriota bacterium]
VVGNCGFSPAPVSEEHRGDLKGFALYLPPGMDFSWRSMEEYLARYEDGGVALNVAQLGQSIYLAAAKGVEVKSRRNTLDVNLVVQATKELDVKFALNSYKKEGTQPWGASFAFNDAIELPLPIDQRTTNVEAAAEWANQKGMFRVGYEGSYFDNNISTLVWANPYRATDSTHASAYSNAALGGSSLGRMPLSPTNHANGVSASGLIKLPERTSINASFGVADWKQNEPLLPYSINPAVPVIPLERSTAEAEARIISGNVNFVTRPTNYFGLTARFRYSDRNNKTALFDATEYIRFDGVMEETGGENEPVSIKRQSFNVDASFTPLAYAAFRLGYGREASDYTYRMFSSSTENTFRASIDSIGSPFVTVRAMFEHANRDGTFEPHVLVEAGQQPDMRQYDVANRRRDRGTLLVDVTPNAFVGFSASIAAGRDDYPDQGFGLLNNKNQAYTVGIDLAPKEQIALGLSFGREKYEALQQSRNANPSGDYGSWMDPNRIWNVKNEETVDSYGAYLDLIKALPKTEIRIGYDYNRSDNGFLFGGPRIQELLTGRAITPGAPNPCAVGVTSCFEPLPNVMNKWQHALVDLRYFVTPKVGIGGGYFFDKYDVSDFASPSLNGNLTTPRYDPLGELYLGYALRPFKAHTGFLRLIYLF